MKPITNYPNYSVTEDGKVLNNKTNRELKPIINSNGYYAVGLCNKGKVAMTLIHRLVASAFLINSNNKKEVNHINGIKTNNRIENLEWATRSENMKHAFKNGLKIITNKQIQESRKRLSKKVLNTQTGIFYKSAKEAAMELQINKNTLYGYLSGKSLNITSLIYA
jgi:hypothetical protein